MSKEKEFPNEWQFYKNLKAKRFKKVRFDVFMSERVSYWELPPGIEYLVRFQDKVTLKSHEATFSSKKQLNKYLAAYKHKGSTEVLIVHPTHIALGEFG